VTSTSTLADGLVVDDVLAALRAVEGIRSADLDPDGELRLDLADDADEVAVATAVGQLLKERFGLGVDPGQVQMVEAISAMNEAEVAPAGVAVGAMNVTSTGRKVNVSVTLRRTDAAGERTCVGEAAGTTSPSGLHRAVAEATLHAIEELTEDAVIGRVERLEVGASAVVELVLDVDGVEAAVTGTSPVQSDERQAIVRAILQAAAPHLS
jgi:hypothetical protein